MGGTDARLACDVTDLLAYFESNRTPMGVARVQMALLDAGPLLRACAFDDASGAFRHVPVAAFAALMAASRAGGPRDAPDWIAARRAMRDALAAAPAFAFRTGDTLFSLGASWWVPDQLRRFRALREGAGVRLGFLFYDAIPLVVPEHCDAELVRSFAGHMLALCLHADLVVAISRRSAQDFERIRREVLPGVEIPVASLGLDAPLPVSHEPPSLPPWPRPYVLCVSTLEGRKNQAMLLHAWLTLLRRHGERAMPDLLLVGRTGEGAEAALRLLGRAPELRRKARHLEGVGDADLGQLYRGCLFAVFNSFHEGWGLPVTEALAHGKLCLAPDHSSLREAGGEAAIYFEPQNEPDLCEHAWRLIRDAPLREARAREIPARRPLRSWAALAECLAALAAAPHPELPAPAGRAPLPLGRRLSFSRGAVPGRLGAAPAAAALLAREGEAWHEAEDWGVWTRPPGPARLRLVLAEALTEPGLLHLELHAPHGQAMRAGVTLDGGAPVAIEIGGPHPACALLPVPPRPAGELSLEIAGPGARAPHDARMLGPGLSGLMLCEERDRDARFAYLATLAGCRGPVA